MSIYHRNMITAENNVVCFSKADRCQELFHRKVRELYDVSGRVSAINNSKKTGAGRQHRVDWILQAPTLMKLRNLSCIEVECEQLGEFLDTEGAASDRNKLK